MSDGGHKAAASRGHDFRRYLIGLVLALVLTGIPFALVAWHLLPSAWALGVILALGFVQIVVHLYFFLHISLAKSSRDDLLLLMFSALIILLMAGGTFVIMFNLHHRMM